METLDLRGKPCEEFILEISKYLVNLKVGDSLKVVTDQDRIICTHQLLRNAPRLYSRPILWVIMLK
nr:hypothetical protein [Sulfuracidifex metallicus]